MELMYVGMYVCVSTSMDKCLYMFLHAYMYHRYNATPPKDLPNWYLAGTIGSVWPLGVIDDSSPIQLPRLFKFTATPNTSDSFRQSSSDLSRYLAH